MDFLQRLQRLALAEQHAQLGTTASADHDGGGRSQAHGAGAGNDQHRHAVDQAKSQRWLRAEQQPDQEGQHRQRHHHRHKPHGDAIDQALDRQLAALRLLDHADDLRQHRRFAYGGGAEGEGAGLVDGAAGHAGASSLLHRHRLARDHAFIDPAVAIGHLAIDRHAFARTHLDDIAGAHFGNRHFLHTAVAAYARRLGLHADQALDRF